MRWTRDESRSLTARAGSRALALFAGAAVLAACAAPGGGASNPPVGPTSPPATTAAATNPPATAATGKTVEVSTVGAFGPVVTGIRGLSLYLFTNDHDGTSACTDPNCVGTWPPLKVASAGALTAGSGVTGALGTITRDDGSLQVTLNGAPLYYYSGDSAAGDTNGQGLFDKWYLVAPSGSPVTEAAGGATPAASKCSGPTCY